ncbi:conserved Plasmodium protein, unknown function [Plasmodium ovale curtisi]|uniref:Uncharacterized protein n=1 Tax=Plasmodium ovale curtisi TaxID=864141 RepID=A0A1A8VVJ9_PLAOA|nr:conserved Plasmodium protein, unknown function [Plasmodium ovale curtisi]
MMFFNLNKESPKEEEISSENAKKNFFPSDKSNYQFSAKEELPFPDVLNRDTKGILNDHLVRDSNNCEKETKIKLNEYSAGYTKTFNDNEINCIKKNSNSNSLGYTFNDCLDDSEKKTSLFQKKHTKNGTDLNRTMLLFEDNDSTNKNEYHSSNYNKDNLFNRLSNVYTSYTKLRSENEFADKNKQVKESSNDSGALLLQKNKNVKGAISDEENGDNSVGVEKYDLGSMRGHSEEGERHTKDALQKNMNIEKEVDDKHNYEHSEEGKCEKTSFGGDGEMTKYEQVPKPALSNKLLDELSYSNRKSHSSVFSEKENFIDISTISEEAKKMVYSELNYNLGGANISFELGSTKQDLPLFQKRESRDSQDSKDSKYSKYSQDSKDTPDDYIDMVCELNGKAKIFDADDTVNGKINLFGPDETFHELSSERRSSSSEFANDSRNSSDEIDKLFSKYKIEVSHLSKYFDFSKNEKKEILEIMQNNEEAKEEDLADSNVPADTLNTEEGEGMKENKRKNAYADEGAKKETNEDTIENTSQSENCLIPIVFDGFREDSLQKTGSANLSFEEESLSLDTNETNYITKDVLMSILNIKEEKITFHNFKKCFLDLNYNVKLENIQLLYDCIYHHSATNSGKTELVEGYKTEQVNMDNNSGDSGNGSSGEGYITVEDVRSYIIERNAKNNNYYNEIVKMMVHFNNILLLMLNNNETEKKDKALFELLSLKFASIFNDIVQLPNDFDNLIKHLNGIIKLILSDDSKKKNLKSIISDYLNSQKIAIHKSDILTRLIGVHVANGENKISSEGEIDDKVLKGDPKGVEIASSNGEDKIFAKIRTVSKKGKNIPKSSDQELSRKPVVNVNDVDNRTRNLTKDIMLSEIKNTKENPEEEELTEKEVCLKGKINEKTFVKGSPSPSEVSGSCDDGNEDKEEGIDSGKATKEEVTTAKSDILCKGSKEKRELKRDSKKMRKLKETLDAVQNRGLQEESKKEIAEKGKSKKRKMAKKPKKAKGLQEVDATHMDAVHVDEVKQMDKASEGDHPNAREEAYEGNPNGETEERKKLELTKGAKTKKIAENKKGSETRKGVEVKKVMSNKKNEKGVKGENGAKNEEYAKSEKEVNNSGRVVCQNGEENKCKYRASLSAVLSGKRSDDGISGKKTTNIATSNFNYLKGSNGEKMQHATNYMNRYSSSNNSIITPGVLINRQGFHTTQHNIYQNTNPLMYRKGYTLSQNMDNINNHNLFNNLSNVNNYSNNFKCNGNKSQEKMTPGNVPNFKENYHENDSLEKSISSQDGNSSHHLNKPNPNLYLWNKELWKNGNTKNYLPNYNYIYNSNNMVQQNLFQSNENHHLSAPPNPNIAVTNVHMSKTKGDILTPGNLNQYTYLTGSGKDASMIAGQNKSQMRDLLSKRASNSEKKLVNSLWEPTSKEDTFLGIATKNVPFAKMGQTENRSDNLSNESGLSKNGHTGMHPSNGFNGLNYTNEQSKLKGISNFSHARKQTPFEYRRYGASHHRMVQPNSTYLGFKRNVHNVNDKINLPFQERGTKCTVRYLSSKSDINSLQINKDGWIKGDSKEEGSKDRTNAVTTFESNLTKLKNFTHILKRNTNNPEEIEKKNEKDTKSAYNRFTEIVTSKFRNFTLRNSKSVRSSTTNELISFSNNLETGEKKNYINQRNNNNIEVKKKDSKSGTSNASNDISEKKNEGSIISFMGQLNIFQNKCTSAMGNTDKEGDVQDEEGEKDKNLPHPQKLGSNKCDKKKEEKCFINGGNKKESNHIEGTQKGENGIHLTNSHKKEVSTSEGKNESSVSNLRNYVCSITNMDHMKGIKNMHSKEAEMMTFTNKKKENVKKGAEVSNHRNSNYHVLSDHMDAMKNISKVLNVHNASDVNGKATCEDVAKSGVAGNANYRKEPYNDITHNNTLLTYNMHVEQPSMSRNSQMINRGGQMTLNMKKTNSNYFVNQNKGNGDVFFPFQKRNSTLHGSVSFVKFHDINGNMSNMVRKDDKVLMNDVGTNDISFINERKKPLFINKQQMEIMQMGNRHINLSNSIEEKKIEKPGNEQRTFINPFIDMENNPIQLGNNTFKNKNYSNFYNNPFFNNKLTSLHEKNAPASSFNMYLSREKMPSRNCFLKTPSFYRNGVNTGANPNGTSKGVRAKPYEQNMSTNVSVPEHSGEDKFTTETKFIYKNDGNYDVSSNFLNKFPKKVSSDDEKNVHSIDENNMSIEQIMKIPGVKLGKNYIQDFDICSDWLRFNDYDKKVIKQSLQNSLENTNHKHFMDSSQFTSGFFSHTK